MAAAGGPGQAGSRKAGAGSPVPGSHRARSVAQSMVVVLVGQGGNRMDCCFWDLALREHAEANQKEFIMRQ